MKKLAALLLYFSFCNSVLLAQSFIIPNIQLAKPGISRIKITWYNPLPGTTEPDKSKVPDIYMWPGQLMKYKQDGRLILASDLLLKS